MKNNNGYLGIIRNKTTGLNSAEMGIEKKPKNSAQTQMT